MASFCKSVSASFTDTDLQATYPSGLLSDEAVPQSARDSNGLLSAEYLKANISSIMSQGKVPVPPTNTASMSSKTASEYAQKDKKFVKHVEEEYCFYDARYRYALNQLIQQLVSGYNNKTDANSQLVQQYLKYTQTLNQKLNDLTQMLSAIARERQQMSMQMTNEMKKLTNTMDTRASKLQEQARILQSRQGAENLYKEMMAYTSEKVRSTNNLLSMYSFLNIFALGVLLYLYRSMDE